VARRKVAFATSNYNKKEGKPAETPWNEFPYPKFNAIKSSKFNAFSVPDLEKLVFTEGSDKAKLGVEEPDGEGKFVPVQIYDGSSDTTISIPREEGGFEGFQGTLFGNSDSFPVGNETGWIEVDFNFLVKIFWRVKTWKATISGSFSGFGLSTSFGGTSNPTNINTSEDVNEEKLVSGADISLAGSGDGNFQDFQSQGGGSPGSIGTGIAYTFSLKPQSKQQILRSYPFHLGNSMKSSNNSILTHNDIFILKIRDTNTGEDKFFINPLSLYTFNASAGKYGFEEGGTDTCYSLGVTRSSSIGYSSNLSNIKQSQGESSTPPDEYGCGEGSSKSWSGRISEGYTLKIKIGDQEKIFTMPFSYSAGSGTSSYGFYGSEEGCDPPKDMFVSSLGGFPGSPNLTITLEPHEYWEYANGEGNPIWDKTTGQKLRDPVTGQTIQS
jgi:hypothetical protein